ncbi:MAG: hypothetical protein WC532_08045 [Candidatus Omnitrophota bacterium]
MIVLWSLCLLSAFAVILGYQVRQKAVMAKRLDERASLRFIAEAGVKKTISELKKWQMEGPQYAALNGAWSSNPAVFMNIGVGAGTANICYDYVDEESGDQGLRYGLVDEESKINVNTISSENKEAVLKILRQLFMGLLGYDEARAQELAACIIDWRDSDAESGVFSGGAESNYYKGLPYPYEAKNAKFDIPEELLLVKGMDENIFSKVRNYVTIYGSGRVNINTASKLVLTALGLDENIVKNIILFRAGEDRVTGTEDDNIFVQASEIVPKLSEFAHLSSSELAQLTDISGKYLGVRSENFFVRCRVKLNNSANVSDIYCILDRNGKILYWREP